MITTTANKRDDPVNVCRKMKTELIYLSIREYQKI